MNRGASYVLSPQAPFTGTLPLMTPPLPDWLLMMRRVESLPSTGFDPYFGFMVKAALLPV